MDREDRSVQDARCKKLWRTLLDDGKQDQLNIKGLKNGLNKMDHRTRTTINTKAACPIDLSLALKNADSLLHDVLRALDLNGDGHIEYHGTHQHCLPFTIPLISTRIQEIC